MLLCVCLMLLTNFVDGYTPGDVDSLKQKLFQKYDTGVRPIFNQSLPIHVGVEFSLRSIVQVDMTNGLLDTMGYLLTHWTDEKMAWNGTEFDHVPSLTFKGDELWHPHIIQMNAMADEVQETSVIVLKDGSVFRHIVRKYYTFCELNMRYYPNDEHECSFEFVSSKYDTHELLLYPKDNGVDKTLLNPNGEWAIEDTYAKNVQLPYVLEGTYIQTLQYHMKIHRMPLFNAIHRAIPLGILAIGILFTHVVPLNCGERISYIVTLLLALVFWQSLVAEELPKNSSKISITSMILTAILCIAGFCTVVSICLVRIASFDFGKPIPAILQRLARKLRPKIKQRITNKQTQLSDVNSADEKPISHVNGQPNGKSVTKINVRRSSHHNDLVEDTRPLTWLEVANALDRVFFIIQTFAILIAATAFILIFTVNVNF